MEKSALLRLLFRRHRRRRFRNRHRCGGSRAAEQAREQHSVSTPAAPAAARSWGSPAFPVAPLYVSGTVTLACTSPDGTSGFAGGEPAPGSLPAEMSCPPELKTAHPPSLPLRGLVRGRSRRRDRHRSRTATGLLLIVHHVAKAAMLKQHSLVRLHAVHATIEQTTHRNVRSIVT